MCSAAQCLVFWGLEMIQFSVLPELEFSSLPLCRWSSSLLT